MRLTIQFGSWSPDLANVPYQYQDQRGPITVPVSDCLNVYYANGTYKSIASPQNATINGTAVAALSMQVLGAFSFFDNVQRQKSLFAGQSNAVQQLNANGTWSNIAFFLNAAQVNLNSVSFWSFAAMGPYVIAVPYTTVSNMTGPYLWSDQGLSNNGNTFAQPAGAPGGRVGAVVGQFLMVGDILSQQTQVIGTGNGTTLNFSALLANTPMLAAGSVYDTAGAINGTFQNGLIIGSGLVPPPVLPGTSPTLASAGDVFLSPSNTYLYSVFSVNSTADPLQNAFTSITINGVNRTSASATYGYSGGVATWTWTAGSFGLVNGTQYSVTFTGGTFSTSITAGSSITAVNGYSPYQLQNLIDQFIGGIYFNSQLTLATSTNPGANAFTSLKVNGITRTSASATYRYSGGLAVWTWTAGAFGFVSGSSYPVIFTGALWFSTLLAGIYQGSPGPSQQVLKGFQQPVTGTFGPTFGSNASQAKFIGFQQSSNTGQGAGQSSINYTTGALNLFCSSAPASGDVISVGYTQAAPYRVQWSAIGDPTNWPVPLTAQAIAFQSGFQDLEADLGPVMFIAGYPLYGIIFQLTGVTRANYVGGNVVFSFGPYSRNRGLIARGAAVQVSTLVYFLSQDGFFVTDGNSISPIGTDQENEAGIDNWFWANVNQNALGIISCAYDDTTRCVYWAIPTGTNTLPDTLLTYNPIANKWTRAQIATEVLFTDDNGSTQPATELRLGLFMQSHQYSSLLGSTLSGYLESCDLMPVDGSYRFTASVRPNVACTDTPKALAGYRNSMQDAVTYTAALPPDPFSRVVPVLQTGLYTRARVSSAAASALNGATLEQQSTGGV